MNQKELSEIRRRFRPDKSSISRVYGCYVNNNREIIAYIDESLGLMREEEQEMYLGLLKKSLSGTLGKNLIDIVFSTQQVADSEEHRLLQTLRSTQLADPNARETLYQKIIASIDMEDSNYLILLASEAYDVPRKAKDGVYHGEDADQVYTYFVCSICPVKAPTLSLRFFHEENEFHSASSGPIVSPPELGFLYPAFDDRCANIYNALFYSRNAAKLHREVIDAVFHVEEQPMSAEEQKNAFGSALCDTLDQDCSYNVVQSVHQQICGRIEEHKESRDPERLDLSIQEVGGILADSGVCDEKVEAFQQACEKQYGEDSTLDPKNIIESRKFEVCTPEVKVSVAPESSYLIETRVIDGQKYLLIPAEEGVEINGISVTIPGARSASEE